MGLTTGEGTGAGAGGGALCDGRRWADALVVVASSPKTTTATSEDICVSFMALGKL
jgi:hypothetical protein